MTKLHTYFYYYYFIGYQKFVLNFAKSRCMTVQRSFYLYSKPRIRKIGQNLRGKINVLLEIVAKRLATLL